MNRPTEAPSPTPEELQAKLEQRRREQPAPTATEDHGSTSEPDTQSAECPGCGKVQEFPVIRVAGRALAISRGRVCDTCEDDRRKQAAEAEERAERERIEAKQQHRADNILDLLAKTGVNAWDHRNATLDSFDTAASGTGPLESVRLFVKESMHAGKYDQVRGLYLFGSTGTGKSHLAAAVAREFLLDINTNPNGIVFDHALRLIGKIQRTYSNEESADEVLDRRINAKVWILDDLGTENPSADVVRRLTEIFTERAMRPTLVTSNLAPDKLESRHAEFYRVASRLGPRYFRTVQVKGKDRRFEVAA